jgi:hypothetical protein
MFDENKKIISIAIAVSIVVRFFVIQPCPLEVTIFKPLEH